MAYQDPEALRHTARLARANAARLLEEADRDAITADLADELLDLEAARLTAEDKYYRARQLLLAATPEQHAMAQQAIEAAELHLLETRADLAILQDALEDPTNLARFRPCAAWLARLRRPEVYRRVLAAGAEGAAVIPEVFAYVLAAAKEQAQADADLIGETTHAGGL